MLRPQTKRNTKLAQLRDQLASFRPKLLGDPEQTVTGISMNSKTVQPGDLYVAVAGARHHGADYIDEARQAGAAAILTDASGTDRIPHELPALIVEELRTALADAAALVYANTDPVTPQLYGVTGTNGKTTTTYFLNALLTALGESTGLIGTIETRIDGVSVPSAYTTPEAPELHSLVARMREVGVSTAAMEVSSHAMDYRRAFGLRHAVAGFTNLTQDHLDLHGSMEAYFEAKALLFAPEHSHRQVITVNGGSEPHWGTKLAARIPDAITLDLGPAAVVTHAAQPATWRITDYATAGLGYSFTLAHRGGFTVRTRVGMPGAFNIANAALAAVMVFAGHDSEQWQKIAAVLQDPDHTPFESAVPGRMEVICDQPTVIVDFAHNPDGLNQALQAVNRARADSHDAKTIVVFGATGDRDTAKRPLMGHIAAQHADVIIVTDDDPHYEDPAAIRQSVIAGAREQAAQQAQHPVIKEIASRRAALQHAVELAGPHDTILAAGRGHETHQDLAGEAVAIDDRVVLRHALAEHGFAATQPVLSQGHD